MTNYLNILEIWNVVPKYNEYTKILTTKSLIVKRRNNNAVNIILNLVSESVVFLFSNTTTTNEMWNAQIIRYDVLVKWPRGPIIYYGTLILFYVLNDLYHFVPSILIFYGLF
jgi:hypothetical protein